MDFAEEAKNTHTHTLTTKVFSLAVREGEVITVPSQLILALY